MSEGCMNEGVGGGREWEEDQKRVKIKVLRREREKWGSLGLRSRDRVEVGVLDPSNNNTAPRCTHSEAAAAVSARHYSTSLSPDSIHRAYVRGV